jgi:hypothetical protein
MHSMYDCTTQRDYSILSCTVKEWTFNCKLFWNLKESNGVIYILAKKKF